MTACRVTVDLNRWQSEQWDCTCEKERNMLKAQGNAFWQEAKCCGCTINDADYFEEE